jgi:hypothetical protein
MSRATAFVRSGRANGHQADGLPLLPRQPRRRTASLKAPALSLSLAHFRVRHMSATLQPKKKFGDSGWNATGRSMTIRSGPSGKGGRPRRTAPGWPLPLPLVELGRAEWGVPRHAACIFSGSSLRTAHHFGPVAAVAACGGFPHSVVLQALRAARWRALLARTLDPSGRHTMVVLLVFRNDPEQEP